MDTLFEGLKPSDSKPPAVKSKPGRLNILTREEWLMKGSEVILPWIKSAGGGATPKFRVSVGWPLGGRAKQKKGGGGSHRIGECFCCSCSKDGTHEIFISPELDQPLNVLDVLTHELIHAFVGIKAKHGAEFKVVAVKVGLTGKMTATVAGAELEGKLLELAEKLGKYPHASLGTGGDRLKPKQTTRLIKLECPGCGYTVRTTQKWIDVGLPTCVCGKEMTGPDAEDGDGDEE